MKHVFSYLPEWPETPYLAIKNRREKLGRLMPDFPNFRVANPLECPIVDRDLLEQIAQEQDEVESPFGHPRPIRSSFFNPLGRIRRLFG